MSEILEEHVWQHDVDQTVFNVQSNSTRSSESLLGATQHHSPSGETAE